MAASPACRTPSTTINEADGRSRNDDVIHENVFEGAFGIREELIGKLRILREELIERVVVRSKNGEPWFFNRNYPG